MDIRRFFNQKPPTLAGEGSSDVTLGKARGVAVIQLPTVVQRPAVPVRPRVGQVKLSFSWPFKKSTCPV